MYMETPVWCKDGGKEIILLFYIFAPAFFDHFPTPLASSLKSPRGVDLNKRMVTTHFTSAVYECQSMSSY